MTNFKNFIPKRKYRERGQLGRRQHLGLLQKKKDYRLRAKDFQAKRDRLNELRLKASLRNPDEFYFKMIKSKLQEGKVVRLKEGDEDLDTVEYKRLLKSENLGLVRLEESIARHSKEKLLGELHFLYEDKQNSMEILVDDEKDLDIDLAQYYDTYPEMLVHRSNVLTKQQLEQQAHFQEPHHSKQEYKALLDEMQKEHRMRKLHSRIDYEKGLLSGRRRRTVGEDSEGNKRHRFFRERRR